MIKKFLSIITMFILIITLVSCNNGCEILPPTDVETVPTEYTVKFETFGGTNIENQVMVENSKITKPENPTKDGFNFINWFSDENYNYVWDFNNPISTSYQSKYLIPPSDILSIITPPSTSTTLPFK